MTQTLLALKRVLLYAELRSYLVSSFYCSGVHFHGYQVSAVFCFVGSDLYGM